MRAYLSLLNKLTNNIASVSEATTLEMRLAEWHRNLPAVSRNRRFSMSELEAALGTQGRYLSGVLYKHGWRRKRVWASRGGPYVRYWEPPNHTG